jgi:hypothetical protein
MEASVVGLELAFLVVGYLVLRLLGLRNLATDFYRLTFVVILFSWMIMLGMIGDRSVGQSRPPDYNPPTPAPASTVR